MRVELPAGVTGKNRARARGPRVVHNKALAADARWWLDGLPELIAGLQRDWSIRVGRPFEDATEAFVIEAATDDGTPAVLKVVVPRDGEAAGHEITALRLCEGEGCVALLRDDVGRGALLFERLGPSRHELGLPIAQRHVILCATAERVWRPAPGASLPTGEEKARWLATWVTEAWEGYKLVDPDGLLAAPGATAPDPATTPATTPANVAGDVTGRRWPESTRSTVAGAGSRRAISSCVSGGTGRSRSLSTYVIGTPLTADQCTGWK